MENFKKYKNKVFEYISDARVYGFKNPENNIIEEILIPNEIEKLDDLNITSYRSRWNSGDYGFNELINNVKVVYFEDNSPIVEIPDCFFSGYVNGEYKHGYNNLEKVFLPDRLKRIGHCAFQNTKINNVDLPITLETIYANAFNGTPFFEKHIDKDGVITYIGDKTNEFKWALSCVNCCVDEVVINEKTEFIADHCFYYDEKYYHGKIKKITIPKNIKKIGKCAFYGLKSLTDVIFEDGCNIDNMPEGCFWWCNNLQNINIPKTIKTINAQAFALTKINEGHFENVEKIYEHAFTDAEFKNLYFGKNLSFIDKYVFDYLPRDRNIYFDNESAYEFYNGVVYNKKTSTAMFGIGTDYTNEIKIKDGTKIIADHFYVDAFTRWRKKTHNDASQWYNGNIIIPEGVEIIGALAFYDCRISGLSLPSTLKKIGNCAFSGNYLKRLWLYNSITEIGEYAFSNSVNDETEIHFQDNTFYDGKNFMINNTLIYTKQ